MKKIYLMLIFCLSFIFSGSIFAKNAEVEGYGVKMIKVGGDGPMDMTTDDMEKKEKDVMDKKDDMTKDDMTKDDEKKDEEMKKDEGTES